MYKILKLHKYIAPPHSDPLYVRTVAWPVFVCASVGLTPSALSSLYWRKALTVPFLAIRIRAKRTFCERRGKKQMQKQNTWSSFSSLSVCLVFFSCFCLCKAQSNPKTSASPVVLSSCLPSDSGGRYGWSWIQWRGRAERWPVLHSENR